MTRPTDGPPHGGRRPPDLQGDPCTVLPASASSSSTSTSDTQEEARTFLDDPDEGVGTSFLDTDEDGTACEEDETGGAPVACTPEEVSDLLLLRPGECDEAADDEQDERYGVDGVVLVRRRERA